jgi:hypothetical protein
MGTQVREFCQLPTSNSQLPTRAGNHCPGKAGTTLSPQDVFTSLEVGNWKLVVVERAESGLVGRTLRRARGVHVPDVLLALVGMSIWLAHRSAGAMSGHGAMRPARSLSSKNGPQALPAAEAPIRHCCPEYPVAHMIAHRLSDYPSRSGHRKDSRRRAPSTANQIRVIARNSAKNTQRHERFSAFAAMTRVDGNHEIAARDRRERKIDLVAGAETAHGQRRQR